ncbi:MAG: hypothetical protein JWQ81_2167 [Amycolatopsis sp.]|jgi:hypothetical protein|uniref:hypothetical protein n=1 Tax=Amycolatopsis sp. TaxID=37632 RepID=UPI0026271A04|nr:hypothetical protein [Amycolatopsis sp.]MCU1681428.1 hypothetical protein [Amycolatopsis sp.]
MSKIAKMAQIATVAALALPVLVGVAGTAQASTPAGCSSVTQIGSTAYLTVGGQTMASVKQYKGCSKNYSYLYVWDGYRSTHSSWQACTSVVTNGGHTLEDENCGGSKTVEIWSFGASTLSQCTQALGWHGTGDWPDPGDPIALTDLRC